MGKFNSDDHFIYYCGKESLRRNRVPLIVKRRAQNPVLGCNLKNDRMVSAHFQSNSFNITVIQVCAPTTEDSEDEVAQFFEDLHDLLELTHTHTNVLFIIGDSNAKVGIQVISGEKRKFGLGGKNEAGQRLTEFCPGNALVWS